MSDDLVTRDLTQLPKAGAVSADALMPVQEPVPGAPVVSISIRDLLGRLVQTDVATTTESTLQGLLDFDENKIGLAFADPVPNKCGWYLKAGASGTGTWVKFRDLNDPTTLLTPLAEPDADEDGIFAIVECLAGDFKAVPFGFVRGTFEAVASPPEPATARNWDNRIGPRFGRTLTAAPIRYMPGTGQSWFVGGGQAIDKVTAQNPAVISSAPWNAYSLMFNGGMRNKNTGLVEVDRIADFVPAVERYDAYAGSFQGETPCSGMMAQFHFLQSFERKPLNFLLAKSHGRGNTSLALLSKGATYSCYENGLTELKAAIGIAKKYGKTIYSPHLFMQQGEADLGTDKGAYKALMQALLADYRADWGPLLAAQYPGHPALRMIFGQLAAPTSGTGSPIMLAHEELARENPNDFTLVGPWYHLALGAGTSHPNAQSYALLGEYLARASFELETNGSYEPHWLDHSFGVNGVQRTGNQILIKTKPRLGKLVCDTKTLPLFNNGAGGAGGTNTYGFSYTGANITSVSVHGSTDPDLITPAAADTVPGANAIIYSDDNIITITLDAAAAGTLRYAYDGVNLGSGATRPGAWGNFRDGSGALGGSAHMMSRTNINTLMWNWLCSFERAVA